MGKMEFNVSGLFLAIVIISSAILTFTGYLRPTDFVNIVFATLGLVTILTIFTWIMTMLMMD